MPPILSRLHPGADLRPPSRVGSNVDSFSLHHSMLAASHAEARRRSVFTGDPRILGLLEIAGGALLAASGSNLIDMRTRQNLSSGGRLPKPPSDFRPIVLRRTCWLRPRSCPRNTHSLARRASS